MAKFTPDEMPDPLRVNVAVLTPITWPYESISGPPELPAFIAASVCMAPRIILPLGDGISLRNPLTTPVVKVCSYPKGFPMAKQLCPTRKPRDVPIRAGLNLSPSTSTFRTARSYDGSYPISLPSPE